MENTARIVRINEQPVHPRNSFVPGPNRRRHGQGNRFPNRHSLQSQNGRAPPANRPRKEEESDKERTEKDEDKQLTEEPKPDPEDKRSGSIDGDTPDEETKVPAEDPVQTPEKPKVNLVNKFRIQGISYAAMIKGPVSAPVLKAGTGKEDQFPSLSKSFQNVTIKDQTAPVLKSITRPAPSSPPDAPRKPASSKSDETVSTPAAQTDVSPVTSRDNQSVAAGKKSPSGSPISKESIEISVKSVPHSDDKTASAPIDNVDSATDQNVEDNAQTVPAEDSQKAAVVPDVIPMRRLALPPSRPAWTGTLPAAITAKATPPPATSPVPQSPPAPLPTPADLSPKNSAQDVPVQSTDDHKSQYRSEVSEIPVEDKASENALPAPEPLRLPTKLNSHPGSAAPYRHRQGDYREEMHHKANHTPVYGNDYGYAADDTVYNRGDGWVYPVENGYHQVNSSRRPRGQYGDGSHPGIIMGMDHNSSHHSPVAPQQYYQPVAEICTRNGPLLVNTLMVPVYEGDNIQRLRSQSTPVTGAATCVIKSFYFPSQLTGMVLGKRGTSVREVQQQYGCEIWVDETDESRWPGQSLLHFYGYEQCVDGAVEKIRSRLEKCGGELQAIAAVHSVDALRPYIPRLELAPGVILQAFVAHVDKNGIIFLQLPSHPSFLKLVGLESRLTAYCSDPALAPYIDVRLSPLLPGCLVAAPSYGLINDAVATSPTELDPVVDNCDSSSSVRWLRAVVIAPANAEGRIGLRSLDHGFSFTANCNGVKMLPAQFCGTPCQAIECRVVHGKFYEDRAITEQVSRSVNNNVLRQWVRVRQVSTIVDFDLLSGLQSEGTEAAIPVVEMWIAPIQR